MKKKNFDWRRWRSIDAKVDTNTEDKVVIYMSWAISPKKNSRQNFWRISLPSQGYIEWHKRIMKALWDIEWKLKSWAYIITITSIVWDRVKSDCDNQVSSILDTLVDLGVIEDDNRFIVEEIRVRNVGYAKNLWLTKVEIKPSDNLTFDISSDHKEQNLFDYWMYLSN